jgi:LacI family transcriptional regulator
MQAREGRKVATLKDVAERAGVGLSTASRALSGKGPVSADAAARVQAAIAELNFRPSSIGRAMATQSLGIIGLFVPTFFGSYYGTILKETDTQLRAVHRHVVVATGCGEASPREQALEAVRFLIGRDCDGVVVISHDLHDEDLHELHRLHPRMAFLNRTFEALPDASFCADHRRGGELAAATLVAHGHRQIAVISGPFTASDNIVRLEGFFDELARHGIQRDSVTLVESDFSPEGGYEAAQTLLDMQRPFTGLFCANDTMAISVLARFQEAGIAVPRDVSVIGYDDDYSAAYAAPALTSVHIPTAELTRNAVRWLINHCYRTSWDIERAFPVTVTMRASVGPAPQKAVIG